MLAKIRMGRHKAQVEKVASSADEWLQIVRKLRPEKPWPVVLVAVNGLCRMAVHSFTKERLVRAVKLLVTEGMAEPALIQPAQKRRSWTRDGGRRGAVEAAAAIWRGRGGEVTLEQLGGELIGPRHYPPRDGKNWAPASVKAMLDLAKRLGLIKSI